MPTDNQLVDVRKERESNIETFLKQRLPFIKSRGVDEGAPLVERAEITVEDGPSRYTILAYVVGLTRCREDNEKWIQLWYGDHVSEYDGLVHNSGVSSMESERLDCILRYRVLPAPE